MSVINTYHNYIGKYHKNIQIYLHLHDCVLKQCKMTFGDKKQNIYANSYDDTSKRFRGFFNLMATWKKSVLKLIWHDLVVFILFYAILSFTYRFILSRDPMLKESFEVACIYASRYWISHFWREKYIN